MKIKNIEVLINPFWYYANEPQYVIKFNEKNETYLFGYGMIESIGVNNIIYSNGYKIPTRKQIEKVMLSAIPLRLDKEIKITNKIYNTKQLKKYKPPSKKLIKKIIDIENELPGQLLEDERI